jgi:hypothetical protein
MKQHKALALIVVVLIALSLLPVQAVSAQATFSACEGDFIPLGILDPGAWTYPGGNMHVRGMVGQYQQYMPTSDPRCNGLNTVVTNANWDAYGVGPSWGTFHVALAEGSLGGWHLDGHDLRLRLHFDPGSGPWLRQPGRTAGLCRYRVSLDGRDWHRQRVHP